MKRPSKPQRERVIARASNRCEMCGLDFAATGMTPTIHHRLPRRDRRSTNSFANLVCVCLPCHTDIHKDEESATYTGWITDDPAQAPLRLYDGRWVVLNSRCRYVLQVGLDKPLTRV